MSSILPNTQSGFQLSNTDHHNQYYEIPYGQTDGGINDEISPNSNKSLEALSRRIEIVPFDNNTTLSDSEIIKLDNIKIAQQLRLDFLQNGQNGENNQPITSPSLPIDPTPTPTPIPIPIPIPTQTPLPTPQVNPSSLPTTQYSSIFPSHSTSPSGPTPPPDPSRTQSLNNNSTIGWRGKLLPFLYDSDWTYRRLFGDDDWARLKPFVIGCGATMYAYGSLHPFVTMKVFYQVLDQEELRKNGKIKSFWHFLKRFGIFNLFRGFPAAFQGAAFSTFFHLYILHQSHRDPTPLSYPEAIASSLFAITAATICYAPFDTVITRQQVDPLLPQQYQYGYKSFWSALLNKNSISQNYQFLSPIKLFKGVQFSLFKNISHSVFLLSAFPIVQNFFQQKNSALDTLYYFSLAMGSSILLHPFDTCKVISQATPPTFSQPLNSNNFNFQQQIQQNPKKYSSFFSPSPIKAHIKKNGLLSLWRGVVPGTVASIGLPVLTYLTVDLLARSKILK